MTQPDFSGTFEGRFVDDENLRESGRVWLEFDNGGGEMSLPIDPEATNIKNAALAEISAAGDDAVQAIGAEVTRAEDAADRAESAVNTGVGDGAVTLAKLAQDVKDVLLAETKGPKGDPGIAPHVQDETWWVGDTDTGIRAQGPKGDPGPTGTLDLIDEAAQTTIDTVVAPAIEGARDEALGQVAGAVAAESAGIRADMVPRAITVDSLIGDGGRFINRTPWAVSGGALAFVNSVATLTGDGTSATVSIRRAAGYIPQVPAGDSVFVRVNLRSLSPSCQALRVCLVSSDGEKIVAAESLNPQHMAWQLQNTMIKVPSDWTGEVNLSIEGVWETAADATDQQIEANGLTWVDVTSAYGVGNEPTLEHLTRQIVKLPTRPVTSPVVLDSNLGQVWRDELADELADVQADLATQVAQVNAGISTAVSELSYPSTVAATNLVGNGFIAQPEWAATPGSALSIGGGSGIATSSSTTSPLGMYRTDTITAQAGDVLWVNTRMRARNFQTSAYKIRISDGTAEVSSDVVTPPHLSWVTHAGTIVVPESLAGKPLTVSVVAESTEIVSGSIVEVYRINVLNLTTIYGAGREPSSGDILAIASTLPNGRVDGTVADFHRDPVVVTKKNLPDLLEDYVPPPSTAESHVRHHVGGVILRFDDGFENVRTIAAPYMKDRGLVGYMAACCGWAGTTQPAGKIMQNQQLVELHDMGWEVGNHAYEHADAIGHTNFNGQIDQNSQALMDLGLPYPNTMTYPNGSRSVATDRDMYLRFNQAQLTSAPEYTPAKIDQPVFYTGWVVVSGVAGPLAKAREVARAKRYIANSVRQHQVPVLAFHEVLPQGETPTLNWQLDWETFTDLMDWIHDQGYRTLLPRDLKPHNLVGDAGFNEFEVVGYQANAYPWAISPPLNGWQRVTTGQGSGLAAMKIATTAETTAHVIQAIPVEAGQYKVHANIKVESVTAGDVRIRLLLKTATREAIGTDSIPITVGSPTSGYQLFSGVVDIPAGVDVVQVVATASGFVGTAFVDHVAVFPAHLFDPLSA